MATRARTSRKRTERLAGWLFLCGLALTVWDMYLFRKTFVPLYLPLLIYIAGGLILYLIAGRRMRYFKQNGYSAYINAAMGTVLYGGPLLYVLLALNFYVRPASITHTYRLRVIESGHLSAGRRGGCASPYIIVRFENLEKQLVLPCHTEVSRSNVANVTLQHGLFGIPVTDGVRLSYMPGVETTNDEERMYNRILEAAERASNNGHTTRAMELYKRAVLFRPSDTLARQGLACIRWKTRFTKVHIPVSNVHPPDWLRGGWANLLESNMHRSVHFDFQKDRFSHQIGMGNPTHAAAYDRFSGCSVQETTNDTLYNVSLRNGVQHTSYSFSVFHQEGFNEPAIAFAIHLTNDVLHDRLMASGVLFSVQRTSRPKS